MKIFIIISLAAALLVLPSLAHRPAIASAKAPAKQAAFEGSPAWNKADLRLRMAWKDAMDSGNSKSKLECLMKTTRPVSDDDKAMLKSAGYEYNTVIGTILTGKMEVSKLPAVAGLEFVQIIELAAPMGIKNKNPKSKIQNPK